MHEPPTSRRYSWSVILSALVVTFATAIQGIQLMKEDPEPREPHLEHFVPAGLSGWSVREVPLGPNEFMVGQVEKVLNYDEVLHREYARPGETFAVFVAYWGAGKMPTRLVASHTPDRCWTENGWRCTDMKFRQTEIFDGIRLQPAESRIFEPPRGRVPTHVLYWHLVDGAVYDYGDRFNAVPNPVLWAKDAVRQALRGNREQYFIRLTANKPLEELQGDPGFAAVLKSLGELGVGAIAPEANNQG